MFFQSVLDKILGHGKSVLFSYGVCSVFQQFQISGTNGKATKITFTSENEITNVTRKHFRGPYFPENLKEKKIVLNMMLVRKIVAIFFRELKTESVLLLKKIESAVNIWHTYIVRS